MLLPLHYQEDVVVASIKERENKQENAEQRNAHVAAHLRKEESKQENAHQKNAPEYVDYVDLEDVDAGVEINPNVEVADLENVDACVDVDVVVAEDHEE
jgi:hypothetical protein